MADLIWIEGATRSGKTARLLSHLATLSAAQPEQSAAEAMFLLFAANGNNRLVLADRLADSLPAQVPVTTTTPTGFIQNEVILFWPLLVDALGLPPKFPMKLRPEKEQALATQMWQGDLDRGALAVPGWTATQTVRRSIAHLTGATAPT